MARAFANFSNKEIDEIMSVLRETGFNKCAIDVAKSRTVLKYRTKEEWFSFMRLMAEINKKEITTVVINEDILKQRTYEEQLRLITCAVKHIKSYHAQQIAINEDVLTSLTTDEQIALMEKIAEVNSYQAYQTAIERKVLESLPIESILKLIERVAKHKGNDDVYFMATDQDILNSGRPIDEILLLMEKIALLNNVESYKVAVNPNNLADKSIDEILHLMEEAAKREPKPKTYASPIIRIVETAQSLEDLKESLMSLSSDTPAPEEPSSQNINTKKLLP